MIIATGYLSQLTHSMLGKIFSRRYFEIFFLFSQKTDFDISCKLSPMETLCMKCQILFSEKKKCSLLIFSSMLVVVKDIDLIITKVQTIMKHVVSARVNAFILAHY